MQLSGLAEHLAAVEHKGSIVFPWRGKEYVVPPPGTARRLRCAALLAAYARPEAERAEAIREALGEERVDDLTLGEEVARRLHADDVDPKVIGRLSTVAMIAWVQGEDAAQRYLNAAEAGEPGPKARARSTRQRTGTSTGAGSSTRARASTSGTKRRPSASPKRTGKGQAGASTGGKS